MSLAQIMAGAAHHTVCLGCTPECFIMGEHAWLRLKGELAEFKHPATKLGAYNNRFMDVPLVESKALHPDRVELVSRPVGGSADIRRIC